MSSAGSWKTLEPICEHWATTVHPRKKARRPPKDPHNYADAIQQMIDEIKALIKDTSQTGGGLNSALTAFISPDGHTARYLVQTKLNPFATEAMSQIRGITDAARGPHPRTLMKEASISASGVTAMLRDTRAYYGDDINLIIVMTILIVFLILVAILRAVVAPLYLIASVVLSYLSALGVGVIVFQFILGQPLTWSIPGLTFIVLVAMGADYNLLLISRLREESPHGIRSGVIHTVSSTGGVITAAGVIFAASMFGMLFASISTLVQCGFIIGTGLLLDTFLVRTITVPAIAVLVGKWNWWPSKPPPPAPRRRAEPPAAPVSEPAPEASNGTADGPARVRTAGTPAAIRRQPWRFAREWVRRHDTLRDTPSARRCAVIDWRPYEQVVRAPAQPHRILDVGRCREGLADAGRGAAAADARDRDDRPRQHVRCQRVLQRGHRSRYQADHRHRGLHRAGFPFRDQTHSVG